MPVLDYNGLAHLINKNLSYFASKDAFNALKAFFTITDDSAIFNGTAEKADSIYISNKASSGTIYLTGPTSSGTATGALNKFSTASIYYYPGTTTNVGYTRLSLGNTVKSGTANNSYGVIKLFTTKNNSVDLKASTDSSDKSSSTVYTISFPLETGTVALTKNLSNYLTITDFNSHINGDFKTLSDAVASHTVSIDTTIPATYATITNLNTVKTNLENSISAIIGGATTEELNTLKELSDALNDDANFATTVNNAIAARVLQTTYQAKVDSIDGSISSINTSLNGKAPTSHASTATTYGISSDSNYGHAMASSTSPKPNGTEAAVGLETAKFARGDHVHPLQTTISGNAGSASKVNNKLIIKLNGGAIEETNLFTFDGSAGKTINITASSINAMMVGCDIDGGTWS